MSPFELLSIILSGIALLISLVVFLKDIIPRRRFKISYYIWEKKQLISCYNCGNKVLTVLELNISIEFGIGLSGRHTYTTNRAIRKSQNLPLNPESSIPFYDKLDEIFLEAGEKKVIFSDHQLKSRIEQRLKIMRESTHRFVDPLKAFLCITYLDTEGDLKVHKELIKGIDIDSTQFNYGFKCSGHIELKY